jgi:hypothetical protein
VILFSQKERKTEGIKAAPRRGVETDRPTRGFSSFLLFGQRNDVVSSHHNAQQKYFVILNTIVSVTIYRLSHHYAQKKIFSNFKYTIYQL